MCFEVMVVVFGGVGAMDLVVVLRVVNMMVVVVRVMNMIVIVAVVMNAFILEVIINKWLGRWWWRKVWRYEGSGVIFCCNTE